MSSSKPRLLLVVHCYNNKAGVEEHVKVLAHGLRDSYEVSLTYPENGLLVLLRPHYPLATFPADRISIVAPYRAGTTEDSFAKVLAATQPDLIHVVHFVNWPLSILDLARNTGKPVVGSFHDYYAISPYYTMQGEDLGSDKTGAFEPAITVGAEYALRIFQKDISPYLLKRRALLEASIGALSARIVPSAFLQRRMSSVFASAFEIIEYGIEPFEAVRFPRSDGKLRFGFLGSLLPQKGWESLVAAFRRVQQRFPQAELRMYGGFAPNISIPGLSFFGPYEQSSIPRIVQEIDVGVVPSTFAETFSIVLSELWHGGVPAAVSDIGALGDRVTDGVNGKKFVPGDVDSITAALTWFLESERWKFLQIPKPPLAREMCCSYDEVYKRVMA